MTMPTADTTSVLTTLTRNACRYDDPAIVYGMRAMPMSKPAWFDRKPKPDAIPRLARLTAVLWTRNPPTPARTMIATT